MVRPVLPLTGCLERIHPGDLELPLRFELHGTEASLGRVDDNDFILPLQTISRYHAQFQFRDGHWEIRDVSMNGIEINYLPVDRNSFIRLTNNDVISFSPGESANYRFTTRSEILNDRNANDSVSVGQQSMALQMEAIPGSSRSQTPANPACILHSNDTPAAEQPGGQRIQTDEAVSPQLSRQNPRAQLRDVHSNLAINQYRDELLESLRREINQVRSERDSLQRRLESLLNASQLGNSHEGLMELLEAELSCSICNEILIEPVAVQCGHVFCSLCLTRWMTQPGGESNHMCPFCRQQIITIARVRTWDTFLTRVYNFLSTENRESREQILRERQEEGNEWQERRENLRAENADRPRRPLSPAEMREVHHQHVWEDLFVQAAPVAQAVRAQRERETRRLAVRRERSRNTVARYRRRVHYYDGSGRRNRPLGQPNVNRIDHSPAREGPPVPANEPGVREIRMIDEAEEVEELLVAMENIPDNLAFRFDEELDYVLLQQLDQ